MDNERVDITGTVVMAFFACLFAALTFAFVHGALDTSNTWTASDMRGETQRRLTRLDDRIANEDVAWKRLKLEAERDELLLITEPY